MSKHMTGSIIVVGNNIDTDQIYPGRFLAITNPEEIGSHCLCGVSEDIAASFPNGGFVVAGSNFGCGSSREHTPISLIHMGAAAVIADSFARIFFRNSVNLGLLPITCKGLGSAVKSGQTLTIDLERNTIVCLETGMSYPCELPGGPAARILEAGGIKPLMKARFEESHT